MLLNPVKSWYRPTSIVSYPKKGVSSGGMLLDADRSVLLHRDSTSTLTDSQHSLRSSFCRAGARRPQDQESKVNWAEVDGIESSATATTEETASLEDMDTDLVSNVCEQLVIDMDTLYVQMASHRNDRARANTET